MLLSGGNYEGAERHDWKRLQRTSVKGVEPTRSYSFLESNIIRIYIYIDLFTPIAYNH